jgi:F0F1-type ATP synthase epsilon subunit
MKTKLVSALGLALLAASLTFSSSFACSQSSETKAFVLPTVATESDPTVTARTSTEEVDLPADVSAIEPPPIAESAPVIHSADAIVVEITQSVTIVAPEAIAAPETDATVAVQAGTEGSIAALDGPAPVISAIEPSPNDASAPSAIQSADAIVVEITQSVTVAAPGQKSEDNEEVEHTGSTSPERAATEPASIPDTETLALDGVN